MSEREMHWHKHRDKITIDSIIYVGPDRINFQGFADDYSVVFHTLIDIS